MNIMKLGYAGLLLAFVTVVACSRPSPDAQPMTAKSSLVVATEGRSGGTEGGPIVKTEAEWRAILTPMQFHIMREKGTERAFTGAYHDTHDRVTYVCAACGTPLFSSDAKFESGTGWPSFTAPAVAANVSSIEDSTHGMSRTEVTCAHCGGHLGHVFDDGPAPTGQRYCINSASLKAVPR